MNEILNTDIEAEEDEEPKIVSHVNEKKDQTVEKRK